MGNTQFSVDWEKRIDFPRLREDRLNRTREGMERQRLDALLLFKPSNIRYAASAKGVESYWDISECALIPVDAPPVVYLSPGIGLDAPWLDGRLRAAVNLHGEGPQGKKTISTFVGEIAQTIGSPEARRLGVDILTPGIYEELSQAGWQICDAGPSLSFARSEKTDGELALLRVAAAMNDAAFCSCKAAIRPGSRETDISAEMISTLRKLGSDWQIRGVICSGEHTSPQYKSVGGTDRIIQPGDFVIVDMVHAYLAYWSDVARTFVCGERPTDSQRDVYKLCHEMLLSAIDQIRPGNSTADVMGTWNGLSRRAKMGAVGVGHGIGTTLHEIPIVDRHSLESPVEFAAGMALALEVYASKGADGVRLEQNIIVTEQGHEVISKYPFEEGLL